MKRRGLCAALLGAVAAPFAPARSLAGDDDAVEAQPWAPPHEVNRLAWMFREVASVRNEASWAEAWLRVAGQHPGAGPAPQLTASVTFAPARAE